MSPSRCSYTWAATNYRVVAARPRAALPGKGAAGQERLGAGEGGPEEAGGEAMALLEQFQLLHGAGTPAGGVGFGRGPVRLELARPFAAAFRDLPVLEVGAEAGAKEHFAKRCGDGGDALRERARGLGALGTVVLDHQVAAGRNHSREQPKQVLDFGGRDLDGVAGWEADGFPRFRQLDPVVGEQRAAVVEAGRDWLSAELAAVVLQQRREVAGTEAAAGAEEHSQAAACQRFAVQRGKRMFRLDGGPGSILVGGGFGSFHVDHWQSNK